jgi:hypothetical protein
MEVTKWPGAASTAPAVVNTLVGGADMAQRTCSVPDCGRVHRAHGLCDSHLYRQRHGLPMTVIPARPRGTPEERFWAKVDKSGECWVWTGTKTAIRYGWFGVSSTPRRSVSAHRFAYERAHGPIPAGLTIDHLCRNPLCVNVAHLEAVSMRENNRRSDSPTAVNARKTHCVHGHVLDRVLPNGGRYCGECARLRSARRHVA